MRHYVKPTFQRLEAFRIKRIEEAMRLRGSKKARPRSLQRSIPLWECASVFDTMGKREEVLRYGGESFRESEIKL